MTNSELNSRQIELEQFRGAMKRAEHKSEQEAERVKGVCRESGQVMLAINNLHTRQGIISPPRKQTLDNFGRCHVRWFPREGGTLVSMSPSSDYNSTSWVNVISSEPSTPNKIRNLERVTSLQVFKCRIAENRDLGSTGRNQLVWITAYTMTK